MQQKTEPDPSAGSTPPGASRPVSLAYIFSIFFQLGSISFGGGLSGWTYRDFVERRKIMSATDFVAGLTLAQIMPGINMTNMAVYVGQRLRGLAGSVAALTGLITFPFFAIIGLAMIYSTIQELKSAQSFLDGMAAAALAMIFAMSFKAIKATHMSVRQLGVFAAVVLAVGVLRLPMIPVILVMAPISVWLAWPSEKEGEDA